MLSTFFNMMRFNYSMENYEGSNKKLIMNNQGEKYVQAKQEGEDNSNPLDSKQISRLLTPSTTTSSSRQWGGFKNPRIVRVSRAFGGKDRHSKVCTIRGLRDRRIRLSVPTAIQLYDLQERLGLNQPSKVVDWLLDVTKDEIDKLPPLQLPPGGFFPQDYSSSTMVANHSSIFGNHLFERGNNLASSSKDNQENLENYEGYVSQNHHHQLSAQNFFPLANQTSSLQGLLNNNNGLSYNSNYLHWEPPNLSLSQFGNHAFDSQINNNSSNNNSSSALQPSSSSHHQLYFCPSLPTVPSMVSPTYPPPFMNLSSSMDNEQSRQMMINNFQLSSSSSSQHVPNSLMPTTLHLINSPMKPFGFNVGPFSKVSGQQNDDDDLQQNKKG